MITFIGTGGVGKTTFALMAAVEAAKTGQKVAAITVDPSRRLSLALGLSDQTVSMQRLDWEELPGTLDVFLLDAEKTFNRFVAESLTASLHEKIQQNRIFKQISKNLRETHNFAALYRLYEIFSSHEYDLLILDTPPSSQAVEFFEAPENLKKFFASKNFEKMGQNKWLNWIGEKSFFVLESVVKKLAGEEFWNEINLFFSNVGGLKAKIEDVMQLLLSEMKGEGSQFVLVSSPAQDKLAEAQFLAGELKEKGFPITHQVLNQAYPHWLDQSAAEEESFADPKLQALYNYYRGQKSQAENLAVRLKGGESLLDVTILPKCDFDQMGKEEIFQFLDILRTRWVKENES